MKSSKMLLVLSTIAAFGLHEAQSAISVTAAGAPVITFEGPAAPPVGEWSTLTVGANEPATFTTDVGLDAAVTGVAATAITTVLGTSPTVTPAPSGNAIARLNTVNKNLQTRPTGNQYTLLRATLQNGAAQTITAFTVQYDLGLLSAPGGTVVEEIPAHRVFYSQTGAAGSWLPVPGLSGAGAGALSANVSGLSWAPGALLYIIWADDNSSGTTTDPTPPALANVEGCYTIDNFQISNVVLDFTPIPLSVVLDSPTNNAAFLTPGAITGSATTFGTVPATSVAFFVNGAHIATDTTAPYSVTVTDPPAGTYTVQAFATNGVDPVAASAISTIYVHNTLASLTTATYDQNFDTMVGTTVETITTEGWYVGAALPANDIRVVVDDGSLAISANYNGLNYGSVLDFDRSIGTAPTGADRNIVLRLKNNTTSNLVSFTVRYDGETWRSQTNTFIEYLTNYVSIDNGATWIATGADYANASPITTLPTAVNGNDPANRTANITSAVITPPIPVSPGNVLMVRWHNINDAGSDSGMSVDNVHIQVTAFSQYINPTPIVAFTNTYSGANTGLVFLVGSPVTCQFSVLDDNMTNMEFLVNGSVILATNIAYGTLTVGDVLAGTVTLTVRATDAFGLVGTASRVLTVTNPPAVNVVISNGSSWKYFNSNTAPPNDGGGNQWFQSAYNDAAWSSGFAELGGGDAVLPPAAATIPERTLINLGPATDRNRAVYFRRTFNSAAAVSGLTVHSMQDDGAVVYLNGAIVATFNMPIQPTYAYADLASGAVAGDGSLYYSSNITASLVAGPNTVAVEVHQDSITSSDISFDLMLHAAVVGPALTISLNGNGSHTVTWSAGATHKLQQSTNVGSPANWTDVPADPASPYTQASPPGFRAYRLAPRP